MQLTQTRFVTEDVATLAAYYCALLGTPAPINDYYVEVPAGASTLGFSRCKFTEDTIGCGASLSATAGEMIIDFRVADVDAGYRRMNRLGVDWVFGPTTQPWGARSMMLRDPEGHLVNIVSPL